MFAALGLDLEADSCYGGKNYELTSSMRYGSNKYPWPASLTPSRGTPIADAWNKMIAED